jgi:hypothetical protein
MTVRKVAISVLPSIRDELWGRFLGVPSGSGGLSIRLPHLYAPATALENRQHRLRLAAMRGRLAGVPSGSGGLVTRRMRR